MPRRVLADSTAWIAYFVHDDQWNPEATRTFDEIQRSGRRLLTTGDVFDETVTMVRKRAGYDRALECGELLRNSALSELVAIDDPLREKAWRLFRKCKFPKLSLTDCTSFAVMEKFGIREAFTFDDDDFGAAGYTVLPGRMK